MHKPFNKKKLILVQQKYYRAILIGQINTGIFFLPTQKN